MTVLSPLRLSRLAFPVTLLIGLLPPTLLFALEYRYQSGEIASAAEINARLASELINRNPAMWQFEQLRLEDLLSQRAKGQTQATETREIIALSGARIARSGNAVSAPFIVASEELYDAGRPVGLIRITRSLWPILITSLAVALASLTVAAMIYFGAMNAPLRALRKAASDLDEERERALITLRSIGDAVVTTDAELNIQYMNPVAEQMTGWTNKQAKARSMATVLRIVSEETRQTATISAKESLLTNSFVEPIHNAILIRKSDGKEFHIEYSSAPIRRASGEVLGAVMVLHDVSERREAQKQLNHIAHHDGLTNLPNRILFQQKLLANIERARVMQQTFAVLFLDLDRFKLINDTLGHHVGDQLLVMVGKRLCKVVRDSDSIARMGGDEFTVILSGVGSRDDAYRIAGDMLTAIGRPFNIEKHEICVTTSIGIALYPEDGLTADELVQHADMAMYQAKDGGRNAYRAYVDGGGHHILERLQFESQLRSALGRNEFFLEYQPKLSLATRKVAGMEALLRWRSPTHGLVSPEVFIPLLEASGDITEVGAWVLKTALTQAEAWAEKGFAIAIAVNFSARQFEAADFLAMIEATLEASGFPPALLEIEVTESLLMQNEIHTSTLGYLQSLGIRIALDDFGTGYSSLSYLRSFPINVLKIDKSFIQELACDAASLRIAKTIIDLGHALDMCVVAEGVETVEQCDMLEEIGCDLIQGYWLCRPIPGPATIDWLHARLQAMSHAIGDEYVAQQPRTGDAAID